ncbi:MAG TPA: hypothetical protein VE713_15785, partial [Pyrinomonadaceae bacterium]|nr:hypothetical protein [Pyrinomonadaceae bacterium]
MWNTEVKGKGERSKGKGGERTHRIVARVLLALTLSPLPFALSGCRMDMQDQPKYIPFRAGDKKFAVNGGSVRPLVEGTVPRQLGGPYRDREDYLYTGKTATPAGGGAQAGGAGVPGASASSPMGAGVVG